MAEITVWVNTDATGAANGTTKADGYTSLQAAIVAVGNTNYVGDNVTIKVTGTAEDTTAVNFNTPTFSQPPDNLAIVPDTGQERLLTGISASRYRMNVSGATAINTQSVATNVTIGDFQIVGSGAIAINVNPPSGRTVTVNGTRIQTVDHGVFIEAGTAGNVNVYETILIGTGLAGTEGIYAQPSFTGTLNAERNTIFGFNDGIEQDAGTVNAKNNAIFNSDGADLDAVTGTVTYNATDDAYAGTGNIQVANWSVEFVNFGAGDVTLQGSSQLVGNGEGGINIGADQVTGVVPALTLDSSPTNIVVTETLSSQVSTPVVTPTTGNTEVRLDNDSGYLASNITIFGTGPYAVSYTFPRTTPKLFSTTGYPIYIEVAAENVTSANIPFLPKTGQDFVDLTNPVNTAGTLGENYSGSAAASGDQWVHDTATTSESVGFDVDEQGYWILNTTPTTNQSISYYRVDSTGVVDSEDTLSFYIPNTDLDLVSNVVQLPEWTPGWDGKIRGLDKDGTILSGQYIITGTGFGTKNGTAYYDNFEEETVGAITGNIGELTIEDTTGMSIVNTNSNSGSKCISKDYSNGNFPRAYKALSGSNSRAYFSCWVYTDGLSGTVWKHARIGSGTTYSGTPRAVSSYTSTAGSATPQAFSGEINTSNGLTSWSVHNTSVVSPTVLSTQGWHFYECEFDAGTVDGNNAFFYERVDGQATVIWENRPYLTTANSSLPTWFMSFLSGHDGSNTLTVLMDDIYFDESRARVVMTDNATYGNSTKWAIQRIDSYSDTEIRVTRKRQGFNVGETAYLHVFNENGVLVHTSSSFVVAEDL